MAEFDPASVPVYPVVRMSLVRGQVRVDDEPISVPAGVEPRDAALAVVAARAAAREGSIRAVRVLASDEAGHTWPMVVDAKGGTWSLTGSGTSISSPTRKSDRGSGQARTGVRVAVIGSAVLLVVGAGAAVVAVGHHGAAPTRAAATVTVTPTATATELPVQAPVGWSAQAVWSSGQVAAPETGQGAGSPVAVRAGVVFAVTTTGGGGLSLAGVDPRTGAPLWSKTIAGSSVMAGPTLARVNGAEVVLVATDTAVTAWSPAGTRVGSWPVPTSGSGTSATVLTAAGPIIARSQTTVSIVGPAGTLATRALPPGGRAVALLGGGAVLVTDTAGHAWKVTSPTVAGKETALPAPKGFSGGRTVAVTGSALVQAWTPTKTTTAATATVVLRSSAIATLRPGWTSKAFTSANASTTMATSPDGQLGVTGSTVVNLRTGGLRALPTGWSLQSVTNAVIWCQNADQQVVAASKDGAPLGGASTGSTPSLSTTDTVGQPVTPVGQIGGSALVISAADNVSRLYLLPPASSGGGQ